MNTPLLTDYITAEDSLYDIMTSQYTTSPIDPGYVSMTSDDTNSLRGDSLSPVSHQELYSELPTQNLTFPSFGYPECIYPNVPQYSNPYGDYHHDMDMIAYPDNSYMFSSHGYVNTSPTPADTFVDQQHHHQQHQQQRYEPHLFATTDQLYQPYCQAPTNYAPTKPKRKRVQNACQRKAANVRERKRMCNVNSAFDVLKKRVPTFSYEKRLSRIETLKLAIDYIAFMTDVLNGTKPEDIPMSRYASGSKKVYESHNNDLHIV